MEKRFEIISKIYDENKLLVQDNSFKETGSIESNFFKYFKLLKSTNKTLTLTDVTELTILSKDSNNVNPADMLVKFNSEDTIILCDGSILHTKNKNGITQIYIENEDTINDINIIVIGLK
jgi:hypothetical protein